MLVDLQAYLRNSGFVEGNHSEPGHFVIEKAFVEK
jgi:ferredoxin--NADP+ reductase